MIIRFISPNYFEASYDSEPVGFAQYLPEKKLWMVNHTIRSEVYHVKTVQEAVDIFSYDEPVDFQ